MLIIYQQGTIKQLALILCFSLVLISQLGVDCIQLVPLPGQDQGEVNVIQLRAQQVADAGAKVANESPLTLTNVPVNVNLERGGEGKTKVGPAVVSLSGGDNNGIAFEPETPTMKEILQPSDLPDKAANATGGAERLNLTIGWFLATFIVALNFCIANKGI